MIPTRMEEGETAMKHNIKKIVSGLLLTVMLLGVAACAAKQGELTDVAAVRGDAGIGETYIDETQIALASRANVSAAADAAVMSAFDLTNQQRANRGLGGFAWNQDLANAAKVRAQELTQLFSHTRPNGQDWWTVDSRVQYGENLAKLYNTADSVVTAWMNSPTHAANILAGDFKTLGMGIFESGGNYYWAQEFGY